ncbi:hypothetical protein [Streptosporangium lutulentum]|uniref:Uncharacterized protein n=1 Tax=Streptosporangium lutulentum TaxID=1461250 RepID=A0ABT9QT69_9ACTN|nr:hypothetical protein [Streptosporangium lutulentum]MDP9849453.1 hypothetical protein [Streptosporangium lutulentum]
MLAILTLGRRFGAEIRGCVRAPYISDLEIDVSDAVGVWQTPGHHVLRSAHYRQARRLKRDTAGAQTSHVREGSFLFLNAD